MIGLTTQYSGVGLWGRDYRINGPTTFRYALYPHQGDWLQSSVWRKNTSWNNPLEVSAGRDFKGSTMRIVKSSNPEIEITAIERQGGDIIVRLFNPSRKPAATTITPAFKANEMELVELDGRVQKSFTNTAKQTSIPINLPAFGFQTIRFTGVKK